VHSKLRNRLADETVQMQMFYSFNSRALENPNRYNSASYVELSEEEESRGTSLLSEWEAAWEPVEESEEDSLEWRDDSDEEEEEEEEKEEREEQGGSERVREAGQESRVRGDEGKEEKEERKEERKERE
jgi:hypothetical protein